MQSALNIRNDRYGGDMAEEGAVEKIYEAGLELINPGGRPEVLREAAKAWRDMGTHLDTFAVEMDRKIRAKHGTQWRGPAADAFLAHWETVKKSVEESQDIFQDASKGLEDAADNIERVNEEIHQIYIEIGVTIAASVATSFITLGFSAAAGAANAARLAAQATAAATRLGRLLSAIAKTFKLLSTVTRGSRSAKYLFQFGIEYGANVTTSLVSGKGAEWDKNLVNAGFGMVGGAVAGKLLGNVGEGMARNIGEGALGGAVGSLGADTTNNLIHGEKFDASQMLIGAVGGAAGGGAGGGLKHLAMDNFAPPPPDTTTTGAGDGSGGGTGDGSGEGSGGGSGEGSTGSTGEGATQPEVGRGDYGDAADLALGKPAGIFFGEEGNDAKDADADEPPGPTREEMRAENERNAGVVRGHQDNTTLQADFG